MVHDEPQEFVIMAYNDGLNWVTELIVDQESVKATFHKTKAIALRWCSATLLELRDKDRAENGERK